MKNIFWMWVCGGEECGPGMLVVAPVDNLVVIVGF